MLRLRPLRWNDLRLKRFQPATAPSCAAVANGTLHSLYAILASLNLTRLRRVNAKTKNERREGRGNDRKRNTNKQANHDMSAK